MKEKYQTVALIEGEHPHTARNIELTKINSLIFIANELAERNELKRIELATKKD